MWCSDMHPRRRGALALGQPGMPAPKKSHRAKLQTMEQIVQHATEYIQQVTTHDPKGSELHRTAIARHTARLRQRHNAADSGELTVLPAAVDAVSRTRVYRPRITVQPADVHAEIGTATEVELTVQAQVRPRAGRCTARCVDATARLVDHAGLRVTGLRS